MSGECLFDPSLLGVEERGLDSLILDSINSCDLDIRPHLFQNIILSGGSVLMTGTYSVSFVLLHENIDVTCIGFLFEHSWLFSSVFYFRGIQ